MKGTVNKFLEGRGFGFIAGEDGNEYFFHINDIVPRGTVLIAGQQVEYEPVTQWDGRLKAIKVKLVEE